MKKRKCKIVLVLLLAVLLPASTCALAAKDTQGKMPFTDVPAGSWYEDAVKYVWEKGLMTGTAKILSARNSPSTEPSS